MNIKKSIQSPKTLSELCGTNPEAFQQFLRKKNAVLAQMDKDTDQRVRQTLAEQLSWAA